MSQPLPAPQDVAREIWHTSGWRPGFGPLLAAALALLLSIWTFDTKLSLSGDNAEFVILARSLASGQGMTLINLPAPETATKFPPGFPLLLAPVAALSGSSGVDAGLRGVFAMKCLVMLIFAGSAAALYLYARDLTGETKAVAVSLLAVTGPFTVSYACQVMSEIPYLMWSLLALGLVERGLRRPGWRQNYYLWAGVGAMILSCYTRSIGVALVGAATICLLARRDWSRALFISVTFLAGMVPWAIRNALAGGSTYSQQLFLADPYQPGQGQLDLAGILVRVGENMEQYGAGYVSQAILPAFPESPTIIAITSVVAMLALAVTVLHCMWRRRHLLLLMYILLYTAVLLVWPWSGTRFLVPILPLIWILVVESAADGLSQIRRRWTRNVAPGLVVVVCLLALNLHGLGRVAHFNSFDYLPQWRNYYDAGLWLKRMTPSEAVVSCRKPFWLHLVSGRRTVAFALEEPAVLLEEFDRAGVDYAIVDQLGPSHTGRFLVPAIYSKAERFRHVHQMHNPDTWIVSYESDPETSTQ
ncbi:MAG: hypothetical protein HN712_06775 [Gemmatimonadetes bacterium]|jgi:hypothetical protein|nr:hypothetical protein [Gemmatimonadota bacterium]MBT6147478.1 hypothetical protein [Gemmatimonadota bacterium]MBT7859999.1 hypothetical protein [Gemmatimonadota bacterium]